MNNSSPILSAKHIYFKRAHIPILSDISCSVSSGEIVAICGPNGAGKTSLLRLLAGQLVAHSGDILLSDKELHSYPKRQRARMLSFMQQGLRGIWPFTVLEYVQQARYPWQSFLSMQSSRDEDAVASALHCCNLLHFTDRSINTLSDGEFQRVLLARSLAQETRLLLLDEPVSNLDIRHQLEIMELMKVSAKKEIGIMVSLHDLNLAALYATRVLLLNTGSLVACGTPEEVLTEPILQSLYGQAVRVIEHPLYSGKPLISFNALFSENRHISSVQ